MKHLFTQHGTEVRVDGVPMASCIDPQSANAVREALDQVHNAQPLRWRHAAALVLGGLAMLALAGLGLAELAGFALEALRHV